MYPHLVKIMPDDGSGNPIKSENPPSSPKLATKNMGLDNFVYLSPVLPVTPKLACEGGSLSKGCSPFTAV
jgi:hypothetical protein